MTSREVQHPALAFCLGVAQHSDLLGIVLAFRGWASSRANGGDALNPPATNWGVLAF